MALPNRTTPQGKHAILHEALGETIVINNGLLEVMGDLVEIAAENPEFEKTIKFVLLTLGSVTDHLKAVQRAIVKVNVQLAMEVDNPYD